MWRKAIGLRLMATDLLPSCSECLLLMWNKMTNYFKPCGQASWRICIPSPLMYRYMKAEGIVHGHWEQWSVCTMLFLLSLPDRGLGIGHGWFLETENQRELILHVNTYLLGWDVYLKWDKDWKAFRWNPCKVSAGVPQKTGWVLATGG